MLFSFYRSISHLIFSNFVYSCSRIENGNQSSILACITWLGAKDTFFKNVYLAIVREIHLQLLSYEYDYDWYSYRHYFEIY